MASMRLGHLKKIRDKSHAQHHGNKAEVTQDRALGKVGTNLTCTHVHVQRLALSCRVVAYAARPTRYQGLASLQAHSLAILQQTESQLRSHGNRQAQLFAGAKELKI